MHLQQLEDVVGGLGSDRLVIVTLRSISILCSKKSDSATHQLVHTQS